MFGHKMSPRALIEFVILNKLLALIAAVLMHYTGGLLSTLIIVRIAFN